MPRLRTAKMQPLQTFFMQHALNTNCIPSSGNSRLQIGHSVLLRPRAALLHQHKLISRGDALLASSDALSAPPRFSVCTLGQREFACSQIIHCNRDATGDDLQSNLRWRSIASSL